LGDERGSACARLAKPAGSQPGIHELGESNTEDTKNWLTSFFVFVVLVSDLIPGMRKSSG
jgi:hypothetical protein